MTRTIAPEIIRHALPIFVKFLARFHFDEEFAIEEFARIAPVPSSGSFLSATEYNMVRRVGSEFPISREIRRSVYSLFENALNHASFEIEFA